MADSWHINTTNLHTLKKPQSVITILEKLKKKYNLSQKISWTPLHCAADLSNEEMTRTLLEYGADVDRVNCDGSTPLHLACDSDNTKCIKTILEYYPRMNIRDRQGRTALNIFARRSLAPNGPEIMKMMLDAGADPNICDHHKYTPLHHVAEATQGVTENGVSFARLLIEYNADINSTALYHYTPLYFAIISGFDDIIPILLQNDATIYTESGFGNMQLQMAFQYRPWSPTLLEQLGKHLIIQHCSRRQGTSTKLVTIFRMEIFKIFKEECEKELLELKRITVGQSLVTYYDILMLPPCRIAKLLRNSDISKSLIDFDTKQYNFGEQLLKKINKGLRRRRLLEIGSSFCRKVFPLIPDICMDKIMEYLSIKDLDNLEFVMLA